LRRRTQDRQIARIVDHQRHTPVLLPLTTRTLRPGLHLTVPRLPVAHRPHTARLQTTHVRQIRLDRLRTRHAQPHVVRLAPRSIRKALHRHQRVRIVLLHHRRKPVQHRTVLLPHLRRVEVEVHRNVERKKPLQPLHRHVVLAPQRLKIPLQRIHPAVHLLHAPQHRLIPRTHLIAQPRQLALHHLPLRVPAAARHEHRPKTAQHRSPAEQRTPPHHGRSPPAIPKDFSLSRRPWRRGLSWNARVLCRIRACRYDTCVYKIVQQAVPRTGIPGRHREARGFFPIFFPTRPGREHSPAAGSSRRHTTSLVFLLADRRGRDRRGKRDFPTNPGEVAHPADRAGHRFVPPPYTRRSGPLTALRLRTACHRPNTPPPRPRRTAPPPPHPPPPANSPPRPGASAPPTPTPPP